MVCTYDGYLLGAGAGIDEFHVVKSGTASFTSSLAKVWAP